MAFLKAVEERFKPGVARRVEQHEKAAGADRGTVTADPETTSPFPSKMHSISMERANNYTSIDLSSIPEMSTSMWTCRIVNPHFIPDPDRDQRMAGEVENGDVLTEIGVERHLRPPRGDRQFPPLSIDLSIDRFST